MSRTHFDPIVGVRSSLIFQKLNYLQIFFREVLKRNKALFGTWNFCIQKLPQWIEFY